jgi:hypothetical protein
VIVLDDVLTESFRERREARRTLVVILLFVLRR